MPSIETASNGLMRPIVRSTMITFATAALLAIVYGSLQLNDYEDIKGLKYAGSSVNCLLLILSTLLLVLCPANNMCATHEVVGPFIIIMMLTGLNITNYMYPSNPDQKSPKNPGTIASILAIVTIVVNSVALLIFLGFLMFAIQVLKWPV